MKNHCLLLKSILSAAVLLFLFQIPCRAQSGAEDPLCVSNLLAEDSGTGGIRLSWSLPEGPAKGKVLFFAIYRDQRPIYSSSRVKSLFPIAAVPKSHVSYVDETDDGKSHYYAVLTFVDEKEEEEDYQDLYYDEELDGPEGENRVQEDSGMLYTVILPGINSTISPIKAMAAGFQAPASPQQDSEKLEEAAKLKEADRLREEAFLKEVEETLHKERNIRFDTEKKAADLKASDKSRRKAAPLFRHIFSEDQLPPAGGDDYLLYAILQENWIRYGYEESKSSLSAFLAQHRDEEAMQRATFYLAEAEYFTGNYVEALNLFVTVQDSFPQLAGKWIDSCLDLHETKEK